MSRINENHETVALQTNKELFPPHEDYFTEETEDSGLKLTGKGPVLISQYQKFVKNFLKETDFTRLSQYRGEICECISHRAQFQEKITEADDDIEKLPASIFSGFTPGLILTIDAITFTLVSNPPGIEITGEMTTEGARLLLDVSAGFLPAGLYQEIKKLNVQWYDGGVICAIIDKRRNIEKIRRAHLKVKQSELGQMDIDREREYLLARYPLLCLEPDLHVTDVARAIAADANRWEDTSLIKDQSMMVEYMYTDKYINPMTVPKQESTEKSREKILEFLKNQNQ
jgi:hypothetical protein